MPRPPTGAVVEKRIRRGTSYALRFTAYGERRYQTLGTTEEGWNRAQAEDELQNVLADVRRGIWRPPAPPLQVAVDSDPTFHTFASEWFNTHRGEWAPNTVLDYKWQLRNHLLPFFAGHRLSQITIVEVDRYRQAKVDETSLSAESINKTITRLGQILEVAVEYELVARNPVRVNPRKRKLKSAKQRPVHLDGVDQIVALLDAARELDLVAKSRTSGRYALIGTLVFAGTRDDEVGHALVRDLDLARSRLEVGRSKTAAGLRTIDLLPVLHDILGEHKANHRGGLDDLLFPTARGGRRDKDNINKRVLKPVLKRADELLADRRQHPLPRGVTPHKLRHTYASVLIALGRDPRYVMEQLGHTDPKFTLRVYAHAMRFSEKDRARLKAFAEGGVLAPIGTEPSARVIPEPGVSSGRGGFRTCDLSRVKRALSH
jgi:integrase